MPAPVAAVTDPCRDADDVAATPLVENPLVHPALISCALVLVLVIGAAPALALDRDQAAARVQQSTGGRVLAVEAAERNGQPVYRVRVLTPSGEVRVVIVEAGARGRR